MIVMATFLSFLFNFIRSIFVFLLFMDCLCVRFDTPTTETYNHGEAQDVLEIKDFQSTVLDVRCFCFFFS